MYRELSLMHMSANIFFTTLYYRLTFNCLGHRMQNVPENSAKTSQPWLQFQNRPALPCEENKFEFPKGRFLDEKLPFLHKKKAEHSFELSLSIFLSFNGVFLTLKCRTLVLKHLHGDRAAAILLKMDICH